jgi:hypothetical protein
MSERPEATSGMIHAMWHSFKPSPPLEEDARQLLAPDYNRQITYRSTKEVRVDSLDYIHGVHKQELDAVQAAIEQEKQPFRIGKVAARLLVKKQPTSEGRMITWNVLRIAALPADEDKERFAALLNTLDAVPDVRELVGLPPQGHYLFADFYADSIRTDGVTSETLAAFQDKERIADQTRKMLFTVSLVGLSGAEMAAPLVSTPLVVRK